MQQCKGLAWAGPLWHLRAGGNTNVRRRILTLSVALVGVLLLASPVNAATPVANWQMNEAPGATIMVDSSGNGLNGAIGPTCRQGSP